MGNTGLRTDGGATEEEPTEDEEVPTKVSRGQKFHERSGGFDDVAKAIVILLILGAIVYLIFLW